MRNPIQLSLHSSIFVVSMNSFWIAAGNHQLTMYPDLGMLFAAITKQASWGPKLVANMPAPQGHQVSINFFWQQGLPYVLRSIRSMFFKACNACSSPGYEILGMGHKPSLKSGGVPMQPKLQSPIAKIFPSAHTRPVFVVTCICLLKWIQPPPPGPFSLRVSFGMK